MASSMDKAVAGAQKTLSRAGGVTVSYERPSRAASVKLTATPAESRHQAQDVDGLVREVNVEDFLIEAGELWIGGVPAVPDSGDLIHRGDRTYEVMAPSSGDTAWRYMDSGKQWLRVHTKLIHDPGPGS